jgi:serum/glucocorticoid-regulated kinase 2
VKSHPWFQKIDFDMVFRKEIKAPFMPIIKNDTDVSNFDTEFTEAPIESYGEGIQFSSEGRQYINFSYDAEGFKE